MNNLAAKAVALVLATLLWAVIKRSHVETPVTSLPKTGPIEFGASAYGN